MKRGLLVMALCVAALLVLATPAAAAPSAPLYTFALEQECGNTSGGGFAYLYESNSTAPNTMKLKLVLTGALPKTSYDVTCILGAVYAPEPYYTTTTLGAVSTDKSGNGVLNAAVSAPWLYKDYTFSIEVRLAGTLRYDTVAGPAIAFTNDVPLDLPLQQDCGNTSGGGNVALDASAAPSSVQMKLVLTGARPNQAYNVIRRYYCGDTTLGTLVTDNKGDASFFSTVTWPSAGDWPFQIYLRISGGLDDTLLQFRTDYLIVTVN